MSEGRCFLSLIPVREEPSGKSSMVNQLLFGDSVTIIEKTDNWFKIQSHHDNYVGWSERNQIQVTSDTYTSRSKEQIVVSLTATLSSDTRGPINIVRGSSVSVEDNKISVLDHHYYLEQGTLQHPFAFLSQNILDIASSYIGSPYLWGGRSPFGIDCSGLTQIVFKIVGFSLPRDAWQQAKHEGDFIDLIETAQAGDVAFFDNEEGRIIHTGILNGEGSIIHASGQVRVDAIDHHGIYNKKLGKYTHKLRIIKRFH